MSLKIHYAVTRDTLNVLRTSDFTRTNVRFEIGGGGGTESLGADFPDGQLGGQVTVQTGDFEVGVMSDPDEERPIGLFINDAAGSPFENTPAVASGKSPHVMGSGSVVEVDVFEISDDSGGALTYTVGAGTGSALWGSANGLVTNENPAPPILPAIVRVLGSVVRVPGTAGLLGVRLGV